MAENPKAKKKRLETKKARQVKRYRRNKRGTPERARAKKAIARLNKLIEAVQRILAWGGSKWIIAREVRPVVKKHGIRRTSGKRSETFGNPSSDHFIGNRLAYAEDYATDSNHALADEIGRNLGIGNITDYAEYYIKRWGFTYRVQIIAGTHGTGPHLHVGVKRVG